MGWLAVLFAGTGSVVAEVTDEVSLIVPSMPGACAAIVIAGAAPITITGVVHVTCWPIAVHTQLVPLALWNIAPSGNTLVTETSAAWLGPAFDAVTV